MNKANHFKSLCLSSELPGAGAASPHTLLSIHMQLAGPEPAHGGLVARTHFFANSKNLQQVTSTCENLKPSAEITKNGRKCLPASFGFGPLSLRKARAPRWNCLGLDCELSQGHIFLESGNITATQEGSISCRAA